MTIAATSMRIELTGIGPNALNNDADRDDDVWMPNDPTITMPAAAITRPRAERGARSLRPIPLPCHGHSHTTSASPMTVFGEDSRRAESTLYGGISGKRQAHSRNGIR